MNVWLLWVSTHLTLWLVAFGFFSQTAEDDVVKYALGASVSGVLMIYELIRIYDGSFLPLVSLFGIGLFAGTIGAALVGSLTAILLPPELSDWWWVIGALALLPYGIYIVDSPGIRNIPDPPSPDHSA